MVAPVGEHLAAVDIEPVAVVAAHDEGHAPRRRGFETPRPTGRKAVGGNTVGGRTFPVEVDRSVDLRRHGHPLKFLSGEELAPKAWPAVRGEKESRRGQIADGSGIEHRRAQTFADGPHPLAHRHGREGMDESRTAARGHAACVGPHDHHVAHFGRERQHPAFVLQQHDAAARHLQRHLIGKRIAFLDLRVRLFAIEKPEGDERLEDMAALFVDGRLGHQSVLQCRTQVLGIHEAGTRHFEVQSPVGGTDGRIGSVPVRHEDAVETPLLTQQADRQRAVLGHVHAVERIVARHDGADLRPGHRLAKGGKVDFMERPLVDVRRNVVAVPLLVVADEVFDAGHDPFGLHPLDIGRRRLGRQIGIFAVVFEIAAAQRRTIDVHPRPEQDMHAARPAVLSQSAAVVAHQRAIPRRSRGDAAREHRTARIVAHALRAVGHADLRDAQPGNRTDIEGVETADVVEFLVERHPLHKGRRALLVLLRDLLRRCRKQRPDNQQPCK